MINFNKILIIILGLNLSLPLCSFAEDKLTPIELNEFYNVPDISKINPDVKLNITYKQTMYLPDLIDIAIKYSPKIHKALFNIEASKRNIGKVKGTYTPYLSFYSGYGYSNLNTQRNGENMAPNWASDFMYGQVGINQLIFDFGKFSHELKLAKHLYSAEEIRLSQTINNLIYDIRDQYYYLIFSENRIKEYEKLKKDYDNLYKIVDNHNRKYNHGANNLEYQSERSLIDVNAIKAEDGRIASQTDMEIADAKLNNIIGIPFIKDYNVVYKSDFEEISVNPQLLLRIANDFRPELKEAQKLIDISEERISLSKCQFRPVITGTGTFGLGGGLFGNREYNNYNSVRAGVDINIPWVSPVSVFNEIKELKAERNYQKADALQTAYDVYNEIQEAYINYNYSFDRYVQAKEQVEKAKIRLDNYTKMYVNGMDCFVHVVEFTEGLADAKIEYHEAIYKLDSAKAQLDKAVGKVIKKEDSKIQNI